MSDPAGRPDTAGQPPGFGGPPGYGAPAGYGPPVHAPQPAAPGGRYVPPSMDEIWYKTTANILLYAVTCGFWRAAWSYRTHDDLQRHNGDGMSGAIGLVLGLLVPIVIGFTVPMELEKAYNRNGWACPVKAVDGLWLLLPIVGQFIWYPKVQAALNSYWVSQGSLAPA